MIAQTALAAVGFALIAAGVWFVLMKPGHVCRAGRGRGRWVPARVIGIEPAGRTSTPQRAAWGPRVRVRYQIDGAWHEGTLWLDRTRPDDYRVGQPLRINVSGPNGTTLRTSAETNGDANSLRLMPAVLGLVTVALGVVALFLVL